MYPERVADHLGISLDTKTTMLIITNLEIVRELVSEYTRGKGFDVDGNPTPGLEAVIVSATARITQNPEGVITETIGDYSVRRSVFTGFSLVEKLVLDGYRRRAA